MRDATSANHVYTNFTPENGASWEIMVKIRTNKSSFNKGFIFGNRNNNCDSPQIRTETDGTIHIWLSSDGTNWNIADDKKSTNKLQLDTDYFIRVSYTKTQYLLDVKSTEEGSEWENWITIDNIKPIYTSADQLAFGYDDGNGAWNGIIYLGESYIKVNDMMYWKVSTPLTQEYNLHTIPHLDQWNLELSTSGITNPFNNVPIIISRNNASYWKGTMDLSRTQVSDGEKVLWQPVDYYHYNQSNHNITPKYENLLFYKGECGYWNGKDFEIRQGSLYNYEDDGSAVEMPVYVLNTQPNEMKKNLIYALSPIDNFEGVESLGQIGVVNIPEHKLVDWVQGEYKEYKLVTLELEDEDAKLYMEVN